MHTSPEIFCSPLKINAPPLEKNKLIDQSFCFKLNSSTIKFFYKIVTVIIIYSSLCQLPY